MRFIYNNYLFLFLFLFIFCLILRFPFFFKDVFDWDESTYIIHAQLLLDGILPYTEKLSFRPPFTYIVIAGFIELFGKSIVSIRFGAIIFITLTALFVFLISKQILKEKNALFASILTIISSSFLISHFQQGAAAIYSEHIATLPILIAFFLLQNYQNNKSNLSIFFAGFFISLAVLTRSNLVILAAGLIFLFYFSEIYKKNKKIIIYYSLGGILPILILIIPYYLTSNLENLFVCLIDVPLTYISKESYIKTIVYLTGYASNFWNYKAITSLTLWVIGTVSILKYTYNKKKNFLLFTSFIFFILLSIIITNKSYDHYLIQLIPFFSIFSIYFFQETFYKKKTSYKKIVNVILIFIILIPAFDSIKQYKIILDRKINKKNLFYGECYKIYNYLPKNSNFKFHMNDCHIVYWFKNTLPIAPIVHPHDLTNIDLLKAFNKVLKKKKISNMGNFLFAQNPQYIILNNTDLSQYLIDTLYNKSSNEKILNKYELVKTINNFKIYKIEN